MIFLVRSRFFHSLNACLYSLIIYLALLVGGTAPSTPFCSGIINGAFDLLRVLSFGNRHRLRSINANLPKNGFVNLLLMNL